VAGKPGTRLGVRNVSIGGIVIAAIGMAVLTPPPVNGSYTADLLLGLLPMSIGIGLTFAPITLLGTGRRLRSRTSSGPSPRRPPSSAPSVS
jgi:hypothetical protein